MIAGLQKQNFEGAWENSQLHAVVIAVVEDNFDSQNKLPGGYYSYTQ